ncbi:MAG: glycosyltransferase [Nitrosopumilaceae archaeon]
MKVCLFGSYVNDSYGIPSGNEGIIIKKILEKKGVNVIECQKDLNSISSLLATYFKLFLKHRKMDYDIMIIPWRGIITLPLAKIIHKKPIIYFPAFSIYDTLVNDRKKMKQGSLKAKFVHFVDKLACKWSDLIVLESTEEIQYFCKEFGLPQEKFRQCPLTADESIFYPINKEKNSNKFTVLFFGSFIPLHGIDVIVKAAAILQNKDNIVFKICGDGQTKPEIEKLIVEQKLKNIELLGIVSKNTLLEDIHSSDVCLGIFGNTEKAKKVLTNKVFQILASKKPLITMESPTANECHLEDKKNCILVPPANPQKLADAILFLKNDPNKLLDIAEEGYKTYGEHLSMNVAGKKLVSFIQELIEPKV